MCIRDSLKVRQVFVGQVAVVAAQIALGQLNEMRANAVSNACLLYTSDAADERSSVDLGGRRIIKKKKNDESSEQS